MKSIFKNLFNDEVVDKTAQKKIVEEIHQTFYTEVDRLLAEAGVLKSLPTENAKLKEKAERLKRLGFTNTKEVGAANGLLSKESQINRENASKNKLKEAIEYFSFKYPNYKFITEDSVKKI